jgi:hypothetical protein
VVVAAVVEAVVEAEEEEEVEVEVEVVEVEVEVVEVEEVEGVVAPGCHRRSRSRSDRAPSPQG